MDRVREECKKNGAVPCPGIIAILSWACDCEEVKVGTAAEGMLLNSGFVDQPCDEAMSNMRKCMSDEPDNKYGGLNSIEAMLKTLSQ
jgi:hypothetical protein